MPDTAVEAAEWCSTKLIKAMGEAKTLSVRLACVKHQEKLCHLKARSPCNNTALGLRTRFVCMQSLR